MLKKCTELITLGENDMFASILYFGLGLLVFGLAPAMPSVNAANEVECPEGQIAVLVGEGTYYECQCKQGDEE